MEDSQSKQAIQPRNTKGIWSQVSIELTNACNFGCEFCPSDFIERSKANMSRELWEKIIDELSEKEMANGVFFHLLGEPLIHKDIFDAIRYANDKGLKVSIYTNGALLTDERSTLLLESLKRGRIVLSLQNVVPQHFGARVRGKIT